MEKASLTCISFPVEPAPSPQVTPVNAFLSNSLVTDLEGLSLSDSVLSPAVRASSHCLTLLLFSNKDCKWNELRDLFTDNRSLQHSEELRAAAPHHRGGSVGGVLLQSAAVQPRRQHGGGADAVHKQLHLWHQEPPHGGREAPVRDEGQRVPRDWWVMAWRGSVHSFLLLSLTRSKVYNPASGLWELRCSWYQIKWKYWTVTCPGSVIIQKLSPYVWAGFPQTPNCIGDVSSSRVSTCVECGLRSKTSNMSQHLICILTLLVLFEHF